MTGAAGQIAYSLLYSIAKGDVFGKDQVEQDLSSIILRHILFKTNPGKDSMRVSCCGDDKWRPEVNCELCESCTDVHFFSASCFDSAGHRSHDACSGRCCYGAARLCPSTCERYSTHTNTLFGPSSGVVMRPSGLCGSSAFLKACVYIA